jgi:hypothetical protein
MQLTEELQNKWQPILEHSDLPEIKDPHKRQVTAALLENTELSLKEQAQFAPQSLLETSPTNAMGASSSIPNVFGGEMLVRGVGVVHFRFAFHEPIAEDERTGNRPPCTPNHSR